MSKNGRDFFFPLFFVSCCNRPANSTGFGYYEFSNVVATRQKFKRKKNARRASSLCAAAKNKKENFLSTHAIDIETETTGELGNENVKITNFCLFIFFIRFSISLVTFPDYYFV